jgi:hypothetical protein
MHVVWHLSYSTSVRKEVQSVNFVIFGRRGNGKKFRVCGGKKEREGQYD